MDANRPIWFDKLPDQGHFGLGLGDEMVPKR